MVQSCLRPLFDVTVGVAVAPRLDVAVTSSFDGFFAQFKVVLRKKFGTEKLRTSFSRV